MKGIKKKCEEMAILLYKMPWQHLNKEQQRSIRYSACTELAIAEEKEAKDKERLKKKA